MLLKDATPQCMLDLTANGTRKHCYSFHVKTSVNLEGAKAKVDLFILLSEKESGKWLWKWLTKL